MCPKMNKFDTELEGFQQIGSFGTANSMCTVGRTLLNVDVTSSVDVMTCKLRREHFFHIGIC